MTTPTTQKPRTGRRKEAIARVRIVPGTGAHIVNRRQPLEYLKRSSLVQHAFHALTVAPGAVSRRPAFVGDRVEPREYLGVTLMFDHEVIDGAPMARFLQRLRELLESGYGL